MISSRLVQVVWVTILLVVAAGARAADRPNIVYVLCDDLGYGDVGSLNRERGKISTPNMDRLAAAGMAFTNAHSPSAVCTPTRYGILTGRYCWRTRLQSGVLQGDGRPLITKDRTTVATLLKENGYATACIGKWHLGLAFSGDKFTGRIVDGPLNHGFDRFFGISASLDMPPFAWIDGDRFTEDLSAQKTWGRTGPAGKEFEAVDVLPRLAKEASEYVRGEGRDKGKPYFLYLALTSPHTPVVPPKQWQGKSAIGPYGDFVMQTDWALGEILRAIDDTGATADTLILFTSDNGFSPHAGVKEIEAAGHFPSVNMRGHKADIWDGGHRIPLIVRWPAKVKAGAASDQLVCLTDLMATCADLVGATLPPTTGEDSITMLPVMIGEGAPGRDSVVHHSIGGQFAIRDGKWKLALCAGSGGWAAPREPAARAAGLPDVQLYDMHADPGETRNIAADHPNVVARLTALLERNVADGRSTPGERQKNDVPVEIRKPVPAATRPART